MPAGQANFGLSLSGSIPIGSAITATATNLATGDTSAFSGDAVNAPLIAFSATPVLRERAGQLGRDHGHPEHGRRQLDGRVRRGAGHGDRGR